MDFRKIVSEIGLPLTLDEIRRLSQILSSVQSGSDTVITTPYVTDNRSEAKILEGWDFIFDRRKSELNDVLLGIEYKQRSKYGPRSIAVPWEDRRSGVYNSFAQGKNTTISVDFTRVPGYQKGRLRPLSVETASTYLKPNTNSGLPYLCKKKYIIDDVKSNYKESSDLSRLYPAVPFTRTQESGKTRTVWGVDTETILNEMRYYQPLLQFQKQMSWRAALRSASDLDDAMTELIDYARVNNRYLISIDFSTFDDTVKPNIQELAFAYIKSLYQIKFGDEIDFIKERFSSIPLVTPDGVLFGKHGIPSGSAFTNEVGSLAQYLMAMTSNEDLAFSQVQGDDGVYSVLDPDNFKNTFRQQGLIVNDDKSDVSQDYVLYLQNLYHVDYRQDDGKIRGVYPTYRALLRLVYQERFEQFVDDGISGKDYYAIRTLSILENVRNHPLFEDLVKYVMSLDKYSLLPSDQGIQAFTNRKKMLDGKDYNFKTNQYAESTGIRNYESYKLVKKLSS